METTLTPAAQLHNAPSLAAWGRHINRAAAVVLLGWIGLFKFTPTEAEAIRPLLETSPFMAWLLPAFGTQGASNVIGGFELVTALLLVLALWRRRLDRLAGALLVLMSLGTLSFLITSDGMFATIDGLWVPTGGAFVLKDLLLLGTGLHVLARGLAR